MAVIYHSQRNDILLSGGSTNVSVSYTCSSKDNTVLLLIVRVDGGAVSSVSYGGRDFTVLATNGSVTLYAMKAPPQGANTLSINCDTYVSILTSMADFSGVDQTNTFTPTVSSTGTGTAWSTGLVTLAPGGMGYGGFYTNYTVSSGTITASGSTSLLAASRNSLNGKRFGHGIISQPTTLNWSFSGSSVAWWTIGVGLTPYEELQNRPRPSRIYRDRVSQPQEELTILPEFGPVAGWVGSNSFSALPSGTADPTFSGWTFGTGLGGRGVDFINSNTQRVQLPGATSPGSNFIAVVCFQTLVTTTSGIFMAGKTHWTQANGFLFTTKNDVNTLELNGGDNTFPTIAVPNIGTVDGVVKTLVVRFRGGSADVFLNGISFGTVTITSAGIWPSGLGIGNYSGTGAGNLPNRRFYMGAVVRYGDPLELSKSPWQLFAPRPVWLNVSEAAASPISNKPLMRHIDRVSQPQDAVEVDRSSSFSRELVLSVAAIPGLTQNPASRIEVHPVGAPTSVFTSRGSAASLTSAGGLFAFSNSLLDLPADFTMSAWIYISSTPTAHRIFSKGTSGVTWESYIFGVGVTPSGQQRFGVQFRTGNSETPRYWAEQVGYITQNGWYRVIGTHDGTTISLYINGMLDHAGAGNSSGPYINTSRLFIGGHYNNTPAYTTQALNYPVQDARIYRRCWTAEEVRRDYAQSWQLFAKEEKFIQTAYAPKAPWSVAKSRVLGTSTGAPATVATASRVQVPWQRQPQVATDLQFESIASNLLIALNPSAGLRNMVVRGPKISVTGTPTVGASSSGVAISNFSAANYLSFINPISVDGPGTVFLLMQNTSTVDQGGHTLTSGTGTGAQEHYPFSNNLYIATLGDTRWVNGTSVPGGVSQLLKPYSVAVTKKAGITGSLWPVFRLYVNGINISTSTSGTTGANPGVTFTLGLNTQSGTAYGGRLMLFAMWERELSAAEINLLHINPWQLFAPRTAQIPVGVSP